MVQSSLRKQTNGFQSWTAFLLGNILMRIILRHRQKCVKHPDAGGRCGSFIRVFHCVDLQHIFASMIWESSILKGGISTFFEMRKVVKTERAGLHATHSIGPLSGVGVLTFQHAAMRPL